MLFPSQSSEVDRDDGRERYMPEENGDRPRSRIDAGGAWEIEMESSQLMYRSSPS